MLLTSIGYKPGVDFPSLAPKQDGDEARMKRDR